MADESTQKWLGRNRPPRVQITYDLETRGAIEKKELPLVVGIIADLAGTQPQAETVADLKKRKFIEIDRDNFNDVMKSIQPTLPIAGINGKNIVFETIDSFTPDWLVENVKELNDLLKVRQSLSDLLVIVDGKEKLDDALLTVAKQQKPQPVPAITASAAADEAKKKSDAAVSAADVAKTAATDAAAKKTAAEDAVAEAAKAVGPKAAEAAIAAANAKSKFADAAAKATEAANAAAVAAAAAAAEATAASDAADAAVNIAQTARDNAQKALADAKAAADTKKKASDADPANAALKNEADTAAAAVAPAQTKLDEANKTLEAAVKAQTDVRKGMEAPK